MPTYGCHNFQIPMSQFEFFNIWAAGGNYVTPKVSYVTHSFLFPFLFIKFALMALVLTFVSRIQKVSTLHDKFIVF